MECKFTEYTPKIKERLPEQFKNSSSVNRVIEAFIDKELELAQCDMMTKTWLDSAIGQQLDGVGEIVGYERPKGEPTSDGDFGFEDDDETRTFGDITSPENGGFLGTVNPSLFAMIDDDEYRILLKAKILRNNSSLSVDSTLEILSTLFQAKVSYLLVGNLQPMYEIGREFFLFEREILKIFPTTLGINPVFYASYSEEGAFGFNEDDLGFGDTLNPNNGGNLASII